MSLVPLAGTPRLAGRGRLRSECEAKCREPRSIRPISGGDARISTAPDVGRAVEVIRNTHDRERNVAVHQPQRRCTPAVTIAVCGLAISATQGQLQFDPPFRTRLLVGATVVTTADVTGDGRADVCVIFEDPTELAVYSLNETETFFDMVHFQWLHEFEDVTDMVAADLDGDGDTDLAIVDAASEQVIVLQNNGGGAFTPLFTGVLVEAPRRLTAGDVDGDGDIDLAVASDSTDVPTQASGITILLNAGSGSFQLGNRLMRGFMPREPILADFDADGDLDLLATSHRAEFAVARNIGDGDLRPIHSTILPLDIAAAAVSDFDHDGDADAVIVHTGTNVPTQCSAMTVLLNEAGKFFRKITVAYGFHHGNDVQVGDLDGDQTHDYVFANPEYEFVSVRHVDDVEDVFGPSQGVDVGLTQKQIELADFNGDGTTDILVLNDDFSKMAAALNRTPYILPGDFDGDGDVDQHDLAFLLAHYNIDDGGDLDGDGFTNQSDLGILLRYYDDA